MCCRAFELEASLPGASQLEIEVWDYDMLSSNDLIGRTVIDLEDRLFEPRWEALGEGQETDGGPEARCRPKPVETRQLWAPTSTNPQGSISLWVDILTIKEAKKYPLIDISLPPPEPYEIRVIIWRTKGVPAEDVSGMNDLYVKAWLEGEKEQKTDIHWRSKGGKGSFNWRCKFNVLLPNKLPRLTLQMWDADVLKYNDCIGETSIDLLLPCHRAFRKSEVVNVFKKPPPKPPKVEEVTEDVDGDDETKGDADGEAEGDADEEDENTGLLATQQSYGATDDGVAGDGDGDGAGADDDGADLPIATQPKKAKQAKAKKSGPGLQKPKLPGKLGGKSDDAAATGDGGGGGGSDPASEAQAAVGSLLEMMGLPAPAQEARYGADWVDFMRTDPDTGAQEYRGSVLVSIEVMPQAAADAAPAGYGRSEPNANPVLPKPTGRLKFSMNPFYMMTELMGPSICFTVCVCCICIISVLLFVFGAPFLSSILTLDTMLPPPASTIVPASIGGAIILCCCYCLIRARCMSMADEEERNKMD